MRFVRKANLDVIGHMSDNDLYRQIDYIKKSIFNIRKKRDNGGGRNILKDFQEEFCYFFRELETREMRKKIHEEYLESMKKTLK